MYVAIERVYSSESKIVLRVCLIEELSIGMKTKTFWKSRLFKSASVF